MNRHWIRLNLVVLFTVLCACVTATAFAGGKIRVYNETDQVIHPWFKNSCWSIVPPTSDWVFFGGIAPRDEFEWDFTSFSTCASPEIQFTYTTDFTPPQDPVKGNLRVLFMWAPDTNYVLQVGEKIRALEMEAPGQDGR